MIMDNEIASILSEDEDIIYRAKKLLNTANNYGGKDNISLVIIEP